MNIKASVIIPNWNGRYLLPDCLKSLRKQSIKDFEVIVVDNGSEDESIMYLTNNFPEIILLRLDKNYGFAKAINEGVKVSRGKYVLFLNNDTKVDKDWIKNLVIMADRHPEVVSVGSKLLNYFDRKKIDGVGIEINEVGQAKSIGYNEKDQGQFDNLKYIFGATGGAALFKKDLFKRCGMFDENYFMYFEEVDFAFRAQFLGYKSIFCPNAIVFHKHKASSSKKPQHLEYWQFRNMAQTIIKDFPTKLIFRKWRWLKIFLVHLNTILYQLKNGFYWPPFLTEMWLVLHLFQLLYKRDQIQSKIKVDLGYIDQFLVEKKITFWGWRR